MDLINVPPFFLLYIPPSTLYPFPANKSCIYAVYILPILRRGRKNVEWDRPIFLRVLLDKVNKPVVDLMICPRSVLAMLFVLMLFSYPSLQCYSSSYYFLIRPCNVIRLNIIFLSVLAMLFVFILFSYPSLQYY